MACGELLRDLNGQLNRGDKWSMQVKDENGNDLYLLEFRTEFIGVQDKAPGITWT